MNIKIVVLQRGWVDVGVLTREGHYCRLEYSYNVRLYGTKKGLGEIAMSGPNPGTELDPQPTVEYHLGAQIKTMDVNVDAWLPVIQRHPLYPK